MERNIPRMGEGMRTSAVEVVVEGIVLVRMVGQPKPSQMVVVGRDLAGRQARRDTRPNSNGIRLGACC